MYGVHLLEEVFLHSTFFIKWTHTNSPLLSEGCGRRICADITIFGEESEQVSEGPFSHVDAVRPVPHRTRTPAQNKQHRNETECVYMHASSARTCILCLPHLSMGTAVHTTLCEVPAAICWICFPSKPWTLEGRVMEPVLCPCPHCPMLLVPHAYTPPPVREGGREYCHSASTFMNIFCSTCRCAIPSSLTIKFYSCGKESIHSCTCTCIYMNVHVC